MYQVQTARSPLTGESTQYHGSCINPVGTVKDSKVFRIHRHPSKHETLKKDVVQRYMQELNQ